MAHPLLVQHGPVSMLVGQMPQKLEVEVGITEVEVDDEQVLTLVKQVYQKLEVGVGVAEVVADDDVHDQVPTISEATCRKPVVKVEVTEVVVNEEESLKDCTMRERIKSQKQLLASILGRTMEVPNMENEYQGWSKGVNPGYHAMVPLVDTKLESLMLDERKLDKLKRVDFALFAACWWPRAAWDEYLIVTYFSIWLFVWDDEIDMAVGDLSFDFQAAQDFRSATICFVAHALGLGESDMMPMAPNPIINSFKTIGDALSRAYTREQRKTFLDEICLFMKMSQLEQEYRLSDVVPSVEEYWICRMGTSAVGPCLAVLEYAERIRLPRSVARSSDIKAIWDETNIMISIVNDIISLKKELSTGVVINVVPILCAETHDPQLAVNQALEDLHSSAVRFEAACRGLLEQNGTPQLEATLCNYIERCEEYSTGNLAWSFLTERYGLVGKSRDDGSVSIRL